MSSRCRPAPPTRSSGDRVLVSKQTEGVFSFGSWPCFPLSVEPASVCMDGRGVPWRWACLACSSSKFAWSWLLLDGWSPGRALLHLASSFLVLDGGAHAESKGMGKAQGNWLLFLQFPAGAGGRDGFGRPFRQRSLSGKVLVTSGWVWGAVDEVRASEAGSRVGLAASPKEKEQGCRGLTVNVQKSRITFWKIFASGFSPLHHCRLGEQLARVLLGSLWSDALD